MTAASPLLHCTIRRITRTCNTACYDGLCTGNAYRSCTASRHTFQTACASRVSYVQSFTSPLWISYPPCKQYGKCNFVIPRPPVTHIHTHDNADSEYHDHACNQFQNTHSLTRLYCPIIHHNTTSRCHVHTVIANQLHRLTASV